MYVLMNNIIYTHETITTGPFFIILLVQPALLDQDQELLHYNRVYQKSYYNWSLPRTQAGGLGRFFYSSTTSPLL